MEKTNQITTTRLLELQNNYSNDLNSPNLPRISSPLKKKTTLVLSDEKELKKQFSKFHKSENLFHKLESYLEWIDSDKKCQMKKFYQLIKKHYFSYNDEDSIKIHQESSSIFDIAFSKDEKFLFLAVNKILIIRDLEKEIDISILKGHTSKISSIALDNSSPKQHIFTGGYDNLVIMWDWSGSLYKFEDHEYPVLSVAVTNERLFSAGEDQIIIIHSLETKNVLFKLQGHSSSINEIILDEKKNLIFSAGWDNNIIIWDYTEGIQKQILKGHKDIVRCLALNPLNNQLVSGGNDNTVKLWDLEKYEEITTFTGHENIVRSIIWSIDGKNVITGSWDKTIRIWNVEKKKQIHCLEGHSDAVRSLWVSFDGKKLISGSWDGSIRQWDLTKTSIFVNEKENKEISSLKHIVKKFDNAIKCILLNKKKTILFTGDSKGSIKILNAKKWTIKKCLDGIEGHAGMISCMALTNDELKLISGSQDSTFKIWDWKLGKCLKTFNDFSHYLNFISISENSKMILVSFINSVNFNLYNLENYKLTKDLEFIAITHRFIEKDTKAIVSKSDSLCVYNLENYEIEYELPIPDKSDFPIKCIEIIPNSNKIICGGKSGNIICYDYKNKSILSILLGHQKCIYSLIITSSLDQKELISGGEDGFLRIWNLESYKETDSIELNGEVINSIAIGKENSKIYAATENKSIYIYDWDDEIKLPFTGGHTGSIYVIAVSPSCDYIATGASDCFICLWNAKTLELIHIFKGHTWCVTSLEFTPDSSKLVSAAYSRELMFWDIPKRKFLNSWKCDQIIETLTLDETGTRVILGNSDGRLRFIDLTDFTKKNHVQIRDGHSNFLIAFAKTKKNYPSNKNLFSVSEDSVIIRWNMKEYSKIKEYKENSSKINCIELNENTNEIYVGCSDGILRVLDLEELTFKYEFNCNNKEIIKITIHLNMKYLILNGKDEKVIMYDIATKTLLSPLYYKKDNYYRESVFLGNDLIMRSYDKIILLDSNTLKKKKPAITRNRPPILAYTTTNDYLKWIYATSDNKIRVWDLTSNKLLAVFKGHTASVNMILTTWNNKIISCSDDKSIRIWSLESPKNPLILHGHSAAVKSIIIFDDKIISASWDKTIRLWNLYTGKQIRLITSHLKGKLNAIEINPLNKHLYVGREDNRISEYDISRDKINLFGVTNSPVTGLKLSKNANIMIVLTSTLEMQVWGVESRSLQTILPVKVHESNIKLLPDFIGNNNRLISYMNYIIDAFNGEIIYSFATNYPILSCFFDKISFQFYYISTDFELIKFKKEWFEKYFYHYINYDSLNNLSRDDNKLAKQKNVSFPFVQKYLHFSAIFEKNENFELEKIEETYGKSQFNLPKMTDIDIFCNTPLDILLANKNFSLIEKYFKLVFSFFNDSQTLFHQKLLFLNYNFKEGENILNKLNELLPLCGDDLSLFSKILEISFLDLDNSIYNNDLIYPDLDEPIFIEINSIYNCNKEFIHKKLNYKTGNKIDNKIELEIEEETELEIEKSSTVKCKIVCLPDIINIMDERTNFLVDYLSKCESDNEIFSNKILSMLINFMWLNEIKYYYIIDVVIFLFFFLIFNLNYILILVLRLREDDFKNMEFTPNILSLVFDVLIILFATYCFINESIQMSSSGVLGYFKSVWNMVDILLIPLMFISSALNISLLTIVEDSNEIFPYFKLVFSITMFCFWFRFISFFRGFKNTSYMIRLIFNVIVGVRFFLLFMILFMLTLASTYYLLYVNLNNNEEDIWSIYWTSLFAFYNSTVGDTDGISDYEIEFPSLNNAFMIAATFLFNIFLLNLLVAIIGDKHSEINDAEEMTRTYELTNIVNDINSSITAKIIRLLSKKKKYGKYLLYIYNDNHLEKEKNVYEEVEDNIGKKIEITESNLKENLKKTLETNIKTNFISIKQKIENSINEKIQENNSEIEKLFEKKILENNDAIGKMISQKFSDLVDMIEKKKKY